MSAIGAGNSSPRCSRFLVVSRAELSGCSTFTDQRKDYRYYEFWTILSGVASTTDILRLLIAEATHERSNRSSSSIRIFSKASALYEFDSR